MNRINIFICIKVKIIKASKSIIIKNKNEM
jgi:hypothetical protein